MPFAVAILVAEEVESVQESISLIVSHQRTAFGGVKMIRSWNSNAGVASSLAAVEDMPVDVHSRPCRLMEELLITMEAALKA